MTADALILDALRFEPMLGSDIGRRFAPEQIKDRAGWGRKWLNRATVAGKVVPCRDGLWTVAENVAAFLLSHWLAGVNDPHAYKAPHALRGTPQRLHFPRATRRPRFCNH